MGQASPPRTGPIARAQIDLGGLPTGERLDIWRGALELVFEITPDPLYRLFEDEGGVAAYILGGCLDRCRAILGASTGNERSIGELAFSHGFSSEPHFSRAFRRRFGIAPRDVRRWR